MKLTAIFISSLLLSPMAAVAQNTEPPPAKEIILTEPEKTTFEKSKEALEKASNKVTSTLNQTREKRARSKNFVLGSYSPVDLIIPGKYGVTFGKIQSAEQSWEFEYLKGSFSVPFVVQDLGKMEDKRYSLIKRKYNTNNSFNFSYGLSYFEFDIHLGDKYLSSINGNYPSANMLEVNAVGFNLALGNRWSFNNNFTIGLDWFSWAQPVFITKKHNSYADNTNNQGHRDDSNKAVSIISHFPRVAVFKLQLGATF